jgi:hypothetical protein
MNLAEIFSDWVIVPSTPAESTAPARDNTHKGPWEHTSRGTRV